MNGPAELARREERLVRILERASASARFGLGERWLFAAGGALGLAGVVVIGIGWVGASHTVLVAGQIPYLISGGLLGLAFVFLGGFLYFGHWLAVLVRESRERGADDRDDLAELRRTLEEVKGVLAQLVAAPLGSPSDDVASARAAAASAEVTPATSASENGSGVAPRNPTAPALGPAPALFVTSRGTMLHRADCRMLAGRANVRLATTTAGLKPCGMCRPLDGVVADEPA
jgi:hypothetical protein